MNIYQLHPQAWSALQSRRAKLPHALLLTGQAGLGKSELAMAFAASLLCESPRADGVACGQCLACNWFSQGNHPDFRLLQPEALGDEGEAEEGKKKASQQITIAQVRGLDDFLNVGTHRAGLRIILINPAEAMNRNTANALLKSLEEPGPSTLFLLVSNETLRLLPTLRSRCQAVPVATPAAALAEAYLADSGLADAGRWLALAGGAPLQAAALAASGNLAWLDVLLKSLAAGPEINVLNGAAELDKLVRDGKGRLPLKMLVEAMQKWLMDLTLAANRQPLRYFLAQQDTIQRLTAMIPLPRLLREYRAVTAQRRDAEQPLNARLFLESLFLSYRGLFKTSPRA